MSSNRFMEPFTTPVRRIDREAGIAVLLAQVNNRFIGDLETRRHQVVEYEMPCELYFEMAKATLGKHNYFDFTRAQTTQKDGGGYTSIDCPASDGEESLRRLLKQAMAGVGFRSKARFFTVDGNELNLKFDNWRDQRIRNPSELPAKYSADRKSRRRGQPADQLAGDEKIGALPDGIVLREEAPALGFAVVGRPTYDLVATINGEEAEVIKGGFLTREDAETALGRHVLENQG